MEVLQESCTRLIPLRTQMVGFLSEGSSIAIENVDKEKCSRT
jgi:hypothetical protein